jgi:hypothetical protein
MVHFDPNPSASGTEYCDIPIENELLLTECGFTKFRLPLNDNATKMILHNDKFKSMITYVDFDKYNTIDKTVKLLSDKLLEEQIIRDQRVIETICTYFRNACVLLAEDPSNEFFKKGSGNEKSNKSSTKSKTAYKYSNEGTISVHESEVPIVDEEVTYDVVSLLGPSIKDDSDRRIAVLQQLHPNIKEQLSDNVWEIVSYNPLRFVIADSKFRQTVFASVKNKSVKMIDDNGNSTGTDQVVPYLEFHNIILGAIPTEVTLHESPLSLADLKYTIKFLADSGRAFCIGPKRLEEVVSELREKALVLISRGATEALSAIINAFTKDRKIIVDNQVNTAGFYFIDGIVRSYKTNHASPTLDSIRKFVELIDILQTKYKRKEIFPTIIKWAAVAPFNFAFKQISGSWIPWLHLYGWPNTGKTSGGDIVCAVWRRYLHREHKIPFTNLDTVAKFGEALSKSTYPVTVNEVGSLGEDRHRSLSEMFKTAIEGTVARSKFINKVHYTEIPAYCACVLTSNSQPPTDPGYRRRAVSICFTQADMPTNEEQEAFNKLMRERVSRELAILGDFAANYILDNQKQLLLSDKGIDWKAIAATIISNIYHAAGRDPPE